MSYTILSLTITHGRVTFMAEYPEEYELIASGQALMQGGMLDLAISAFNDALRVNPDCATGYYYRGLAYRNTGNSDQALLDYDRSISIDPDYAAAYYAKGVVLRQSGDFQKAILQYNHAIDLLPGDPDSVSYTHLTLPTILLV